METTNRWYENNVLRNIAVALGVILALFLAAQTVSALYSLSYADRTTPPYNVVSVYGKGEIVATPDIATFTASVTEEAATVADAQKEATAKMNAIIDYVKKSGVEDKDVKTLSYNIYPRYDYVGATYYAPGRQVLAAYVVSQAIEIKVRDTAKAGDLLSGIGEFGAENVSGLSFTVDDIDEVMREARDLAIEDAREQAEKLAASLGVRLGSITGYYEMNPGYPGPIYYAKEGMGGGRDAVAQNAPSLPTGENKIVSNVTVTYEIK